ncbi:MAG: hypothetical protein ACFE9N_11880, partial [Promethearchaeota archaeon]
RCMLDELLIFLGVYIISLGMSGFLMSDRAGVLKPIALRLFFIGVVFHELAHYGMSLAVGRKPADIRVKWRDDKDKHIRNPRGTVASSRPESFLQAFVIALAPLYLSTWFIFFLWFGVIFTPLYNPLIKTLAVFTLLSVLLGASPSGQDLKTIGYAFKHDPKNSWYQVLLIICSSLILLSFMAITHIVFLLDFFYYLAITGIYITLKFSILGINRIIASLQNYKKPHKVRLSLSRRHYKPKNPGRENE